MKGKTENYIVEFFEKEIRSFWEEKEGKRYFALVDIAGKLVDTSDPKGYWRNIKRRWKKKGKPFLEKIRRIKILSGDGRQRYTDMADMETVFSWIQEIPSSKAEPFRMWLAMTGQERIREIKDPERAVDRALENWRKMGRDEKWILQRMMSQETRQRLTEYWGTHGITEGEEYRMLTNIVHEAWSNMTVQEHKNLKGLKSQNLRDHMTEAELIFMALAEMSVRQIAEYEESKGYEANVAPAEYGGKIARNARKELEERTGKNVLSKENYLSVPRSKRENKKRYEK